MAKISSVMKHTCYFRDLFTYYLTENRDMIVINNPGNDLFCMDDELHYLREKKKKEQEVAGDDEEGRRRAEAGRAGTGKYHENDVPGFPPDGL
jgi:hypothetical protein